MKPALHGRLSTMLDAMLTLRHVAAMRARQDSSRSAEAECRQGVSNTCIFALIIEYLMGFGMVTDPSAQL